MDRCKINLLNIDRKKETKIALQGQIKLRQTTTAVLSLVVAVVVLLQITCFSGNLLAAPIKVSSSETESIQSKKTFPISAENGGSQHLRLTKRLVEDEGEFNGNSQTESIITQQLNQLNNNSNNNNNNNLSVDKIITKERFSEVKGHLLLLFALLVLINLIVIFGNILVILAVYATAKLRNVTNIFIVSLATADLLLGVLVLPYALTFEILDVWIFGRIWCRGWLVTDVWISTASILNLCAISVDRYVAVTRPVKYRSIMTPPRAKTIVAAVWIVSFLICFPPLLQQWKPSTSTLTSTSATTMPTASPLALSSSDLLSIDMTTKATPLTTETMTATMKMTTSAMTNKQTLLSGSGESDAIYLPSQIQQIRLAKISRKRRSMKQDDEPIKFNYANPTTSARYPKLEVAADNTMKRDSAQGSRQKATILALKEAPIPNQKELLSQSRALNDTKTQEQHLTRTSILMTTTESESESKPDSDSDSDSLLLLPMTKQPRTKILLDLANGDGGNSKTKRKILANNEITSKEGAVNGNAIAGTLGTNYGLNEKRIRRPLVLLLVGLDVVGTELKANYQLANEPELPQQVTTILPALFGITHLHNSELASAKASIRNSMEDSIERRFNRSIVGRKQRHEDLERNRNRKGSFHSIGELFGIGFEENGEESGRRKEKREKKEKEKEISRERAKIVKSQMEVIRVIDNKLCLVNLVSSSVAVVVKPNQLCCINVILVPGGKEDTDEENVDKEFGKRTNRKRLFGGRSEESVLAKAVAENINEIISKLLTLSRRELIKIGALAYLDITDMHTNKQNNGSSSSSSSSNNNNNNNNKRKKRNKLAEKSLNRKLDLAKILIGELSLKQMKQQAKDHDGKFASGLEFKSAGRGQTIVSKRLDVKSGKRKFKRGDGGAIKGLADFEMQSLMKSSSLSLLLLLSLFRSEPTQPAAPKTRAADSPDLPDLPTSTSAGPKPGRPPGRPFVKPAGESVAPTRSLLVLPPTMATLDLNHHNTGTSGTTKPASEENILEAIELLTGSKFFSSFSQDQRASYQNENLNCDNNNNSNNNSSDNKNNNNYYMGPKYILHNVRIRLENSTFTTPLWRGELAKSGQQQQRPLLWYFEPTLLLFSSSDHQNLTRELGSEALLDFLSTHFLPPFSPHLSWPTSTSTSTPAPHSSPLSSSFFLDTLSSGELKQQQDIEEGESVIATTMALQGATNTQRESSLGTIRVITDGSYFGQQHQSERMSGKNVVPEERRLNSTRIASVSRVALKWWSHLAMVLSMAVNFNQEFPLLSQAPSSPSPLLSPPSPPSPQPPPMSLPFWRHHRSNQSVADSNRQLSGCCLSCYFSISIAISTSNSTNFHRFLRHCFWRQIALPDNDKSALASGLLAILQTNTSGGAIQMEETKSEQQQQRNHIRQTIRPLLDYYFHNKTQQRGGRGGEQHTVNKGCQMKLRSQLYVEVRKPSVLLIASCTGNQTNYSKPSLSFNFSIYFIIKTSIDYEYINCARIQCKFYNFKQETEEFFLQEVYDILVDNVDHVDRADRADRADHNQNDHDKFRSSYSNYVINKREKATPNDKAHSNFYGQFKREDKRRQRREVKQEEVVLVTGSNSDNSSLTDSAIKRRLSFHKSVNKMEDQQSNAMNGIRHNTLLPVRPLNGGRFHSLGSTKTKVKREDEGNNSQEDNYGDNEKMNNGGRVGERFSGATETTSTSTTTTTDSSQFDTNESNTNSDSRHNDGWYQTKTNTLNNRRKKSGCALFDDKPYVIYSALGSFYIPMLIMIFFYSRIYLVASRAQKAMRRGYMTTKWPVSGSASSAGGSGRCGESDKTRMGGAEQVTLRIHRREKSPAPAPGTEEGAATTASGSHHHHNNNHTTQSTLLKLTEIERQKQQQSILSSNLERKESGEKRQASLTKLSGHHNPEDSSSIYKAGKFFNSNVNGQKEEMKDSRIPSASEHDLLERQNKGDSSASGKVTSQQQQEEESYVAEKADKFQTKNKQNLVPKEGRIFHSNHLALSQVETNDADAIVSGKAEEKQEGKKSFDEVTLGPSTSTSTSSPSSFSSLCHSRYKMNQIGLRTDNCKDVALSSSSLPSLGVNSNSSSGNNNNNNKVASNEGAISSERTIQIQEEEAPSSRRCHMSPKRMKQVKVVGPKNASSATRLEEEVISNNNNNQIIINGECQSPRSCSPEQVLEVQSGMNLHHHYHSQHQHHHKHNLHNYHHRQHSHNNHRQHRHQHLNNNNHRHHHHHHHHHHSRHPLAQDNNQSYHHNYNDNNTACNNSSSSSNDNRHHNNRCRRCIPDQIEHARCWHCAGNEKSRVRLAAEVGTNVQALANTKLEDLSSKTISDANELDRLIIRGCIEEEEGGSNSTVPSSGGNLACSNLNNPCYSNTSDSANLTTQNQHITSLDNRNTDCSNDGSMNSVQITVSQYDFHENDDTKMENVQNPDQGSIFVSITPPIEGTSSKSERSKSVDVPGHQAHNIDGDSLLEDTSNSRVDRSHSCGPAPIIVVNWNPETKNTESKLVANFNKDEAKHSLASKRSIVSEGTLSIVVEKIDKTKGEANEAGGHVGSQGSGLSIMASIPQAAHQMRKQSKILLSSISTKSSQTLRRLSMVASHPVESLLRRSRSNSSLASSNSSSENLSGDDNENNPRPDKQGRRRRRKKRKKRSSTSKMPKKTIDDYLMAVAGVDDTSDEEEEEEDGEQNMEDDETLSDDSADYSLLFSRKKSVIGNQEVSLNGESKLETNDKLMKAAVEDTEAEAEADNKQTPDVKFPEDRELEKVENLNSRPPSALHRQGAYYERATSRAGAITADMGANNERKIFKVPSVLVGGKSSAQTNNDRLVGNTEGPVDANSTLKKPLSIPLALVTNRAQRRRGAKRTSRWHAKRLHAETKAAKTVAIIIGGFIFCWLPFFTAYLSRAIICEKPDCVPQSLLSLFIWLGYLNSAINPVIYGLFSADFRLAFKNILCRCRIRNTDDTVVVSMLVDSIIKSIL